MNNGINLNLDLQESFESTLRQVYGSNYQEVLAVLVVGCMIIGIVFLITFIINKVGDYLVFKKVGEAPHKCFIPCYSEYMSYNYAGIPLVYFLMWILPIAYLIISSVLQQNNNNDALNIVSIVYSVIVLFIYAYKCYRISKRFGHGIGWTIGLFFLWPFFKLALGMGKSQYNKDAI